jgi:hypothetical protein
MDILGKIADIERTKTNYIHEYYKEENTSFKTEGEYYFCGMRSTMVKKNETVHFIFVYTPDNPKEEKRMYLATYQDITEDFVKNNLTLTDNHPFCELHYMTKPDEKKKGNAAKKMFKYLYVDEQKWEAREYDGTVFRCDNKPLSGVINTYSMLPKEGKITGVMYSLVDKTFNILPPGILIEYCDSWYPISHFGSEHIHLLQTISNLIPETTTFSKQATKNPRIVFPGDQRFAKKTPIKLCLPIFSSQSDKEETENGDEAEQAKYVMKRCIERIASFEKEKNLFERERKYLQEKIDDLEGKNQSLNEKNRLLEEHCTELVEERTTTKRKYKELHEYTKIGIDLFSNKKLKPTK